jgi:hypothetical protein
MEQDEHKMQQFQWKKKAGLFGSIFLVGAFFIGYFSGC